MWRAVFPFANRSPLSLRFLRQVLPRSAFRLVFCLPEGEMLQMLGRGHAASNNAMQPTANSAAFMRETWPFRSCVRGG